MPICNYKQIEQMWETLRKCLKVFQNMRRKCAKTWKSTRKNAANKKIHQILKECAQNMRKWVKSWGSVPKLNNLPVIVPKLDKVNENLTTHKKLN